MIISMPDNWRAARPRHTQYLQERITAFVNNNRPKAKNWYSRTFVADVEKAILSDSRAQMEWSIHELLDCRQFMTDEVYADLLSDLKRVFNYDTFSAKPRKPMPDHWDAYALCASSQLATCPYCNYNYAHTLFRDGQGAMRPTLDHFYPKALYPHLGLTLANLIPSCYACNSSLKGEADFFLHKHLHPYFDQESVNFECYHPEHDFVSVLMAFDAIQGSLCVELQPRADCDLTRNSVSLFALRQRYARFSKEGINFIAAQFAIEALLSNLNTASRWDPGEYLDLEQVTLRTRLLRFERSEYREYPLGKMYADLFDQFHRGWEDLNETA